MTHADEIRGMYRAPQEIQSYVTRLYGRNPFGEPNFRIVWSGARYSWQGGEWREWDADDTPQTGADGALPGDKPFRVVRGMRWVPEFDPGLCAWIVEKWIPPSHFGSETDWYMPRELGGTCLPTPEGPLPLLGPFPGRGQYMNIGCAIAPPLPLTARVVCKAIDYTRKVQARAANPAQRTRMLVNAHLDRKEKELKQRRAERKAMLEDLSVSFSPHVGYGGTARSELVNICDRLGIPSHPF